jgi:hypothetical protein
VGGSTETEDDTDRVLAELRNREPIFHRAELGLTRADFDAHTAPDFWEVGASGRTYDREDIWAELERRYADPEYWTQDAWEADDFACKEVARNVYLLTYRLMHGGRVTRRLTVWRHGPRGWEALYHQGTIVDADSS